MPAVAWINTVWLVFKKGTKKLALNEVYISEDSAKYWANNVNGLYDKAEIKEVPFKGEVSW